MVYFLFTSLSRRQDLAFKAVRTYSFTHLCPYTWSYICCVYWLSIIVIHVSCQLAVLFFHFSSPSLQDLQIFLFLSITPFYFVLWWNIYERGLSESREGQVLYWNFRSSSKPFFHSHSTENCRHSWTSGHPLIISTGLQASPDEPSFGDLVVWGLEFISRLIRKNLSLVDTTKKLAYNLCVLYLKQGKVPQCFCKRYRPAYTVSRLPPLPDEQSICTKYSVLQAPVADGQDTPSVWAAERGTHQ